MNDIKQFDEILKAAVDKAFKQRSSKGGKTTKEKMPEDHYREIGRKGGLKRAENAKKKLSTDDK